MKTQYGNADFRTRCKHSRRKRPRQLFTSKYLVEINYCYFSEVREVAARIIANAKQKVEKKVLSADDDHGGFFCIFHCSISDGHTDLHTCKLSVQDCYLTGCFLLQHWCCKPDCIEWQKCFCSTQLLYYKTDNEMQLISSESKQSNLSIQMS